MLYCIYVYISSASYSSSTSQIRLSPGHWEQLDKTAGSVSSSSMSGTTTTTNSPPPPFVSISNSSSSDRVFGPPPTSSAKATSSSPSSSDGLHHGHHHHHHHHRRHSPPLSMRYEYPNLQFSEHLFITSDMIKKLRPFPGNVTQLLRNTNQLSFLFYLFFFQVTPTASSAAAAIGGRSGVILVIL